MKKTDSQDSMTPLNILLVEDDDGDAKAVQRAFTKSKIANKIIRAVDGIDALDILKGTNGKEKIAFPFMLLVDLNMPRMGGLALIKAIREDSELSNTDIFVLTSSVKNEDQVAANNLKISGYIVKSTAGQDFLNLVYLIDCYWCIVEVPKKEENTEIN